jgi:hypothetical protein
MVNDLLYQKINNLKNGNAMIMRTTLSLLANIAVLFVLDLTNYFRVFYGKKLILPITPYFSGLSGLGA